jgi:hypothetical protein
MNQARRVSSSTGDAAAGRAKHHGSNTERKVPTMTETQRTGATGSPSTVPEEGAHLGWVVFAGVMLLLVGSYQLMAGLVALLNDDYFLVSSDQLVIHVDYTVWGWVHLVVGAVALFAALGVMSGARSARYLGIPVAALGAIANLAFMGAYPLWSVVIITLDILVIYALSVHGKDVVQPQ